MKNIKILALLASTMIASSAGAQTTITIPSMSIYGRVDAGVQNYDTGTESLYRAADGPYLASILGFKGSSPDLSGVKLNFQLEGGLRPNTAQLGSTTTTGAIFAREAWVGIGGSMGEVRLGTTDMSMAGEIDTLSRQFASFGNFAQNGSAIEIGTDANNVIKYISPTIGGLQLQGGYSGNGASATTDANTAIKSGSVTYTAGKLTAGVGMANKAATTSVGKTDATTVGAAYDLGIAKVGAAYIRGDNSTTADVTSTSAQYSAMIPLDDKGLAAHVVYLTSKDGAQTTANEGTGYTLGMSKTLAPGAVVYGAYSKVTNEANSTMFSNGMTAPAAGKDPSLFTVGISYTF
jgi:predicted porin